MSNAERAVQKACVTPVKPVDRVIYEWQKSVRWCDLTILNSAF